MDTILVILAAAAAVLGLLWLTQRFIGVLPRSINSPATNARLLWLLCSLGAMAFWLNSLDRLLEAEKWTLAFCNSLVWVIAVPYPFVFCLRRVFSKNPEIQPAKSGSMEAKSPANPIDTDIEAEIFAALRRGEKIEAIRRYRNVAGVGLKEAKDFVEEMMRRNPVS